MAATPSGVAAIAVAPETFRPRGVRATARVIDIETAMLHDREERLRHLVGNTRGGPDTEVIVTVGEPFLEVFPRVLSDGHDLVMVGEPAAQNPVVPRLSSEVMHLLRKCPVPGCVLRPAQARNPRTRDNRAPNLRSRS